MMIWCRWVEKNSKWVEMKVRSAKHRSPFWHQVEVVQIFCGKKSNRKQTNKQTTQHINNLIGTMNYIVMEIFRKHSYSLFIMYTRLVCSTHSCMGCTQDTWQLSRRGLARRSSSLSSPSLFITSITATITFNIIIGITLCIFQVTFADLLTMNIFGDLEVKKISKFFLD